MGDVIALRGKVPVAPSGTPDLDVRLELSYTAAFFAQAVKNGAPFPLELQIQAARFIEFGEPVRRYHNGIALTKEIAS